MPINPELYDIYRPSYPEQVLQMLPAKFMKKTKVVADVGAGTGLFSEILLENGAKVYAVEPDIRMLDIATAKLKDYGTSFVRVHGQAESTQLDSSSVELITVASAFQWFQIDATRREFQRILRQSGWVLILWNERMTHGSTFANAYDDLRRKYFSTRIGPNFQTLENNIIPSFFGTKKYEAKRFPNYLACNFERLWGIVRSSSYAPKPELQKIKYEMMKSDFQNLFESHQKRGVVEMRYETVAVIGQI